MIEREIERVLESNDNRAYFESISSSNYVLKSIMELIKLRDQRLKDWVYKYACEYCTYFPACDDRGNKGTCVRYKDINKIFDEIDK